MEDCGWSFLYSQTHRGETPRLGKRQNHYVIYSPEIGAAITATYIAGSSAERRDYPYADKVCEARDVMSWIYFEDQMGPVPFDSVGRQISALPEIEREAALAVYLAHISITIRTEAGLNAPTRALPGVSVRTQTQSMAPTP